MLKKRLFSNKDQCIDLKSEPARDDGRLYESAFNMASLFNAQRGPSGSTPPGAAFANVRVDRSGSDVLVAEPGLLKRSPSIRG
jgi:hypothetical protein